LFVVEVVSSTQRNGRSRTPRLPLQRTPGHLRLVWVFRFNPWGSRPEGCRKGAAFAGTCFGRFHPDASSITPLLAVVGDDGVSRSMLTPRAFRLEEPFPVRTDL